MRRSPRAGRRTGLATAPGEASAVPAIAQRETQYDRLLGVRPEQLGDVIAAIAQPPLVAGPARAQHVLPDLGTAEERLEDALSTRLQLRLDDRPVTGLQAELGAQQWRIPILGRADHGGGGD